MVGGLKYGVPYWNMYMWRVLNQKIRRSKIKRFMTKIGTSWPHMIFSLNCIHVLINASYY